MTARPGSSAGVPERCSACRPIGLDRDPGRRRPRLDQLQVVRHAALGEQPQAVPHDDRVDPQVQLVHEVAFEQPSQQLAAAVDLELTPGLRLELSDRLLDVAVNDVGVLPRRVLERRRRYVLGQDVDAVRDGVPFIVLRPERLPDLPGLASQQQCVRALEPGKDPLPPFLVGIRRDPSTAVEPASAVFFHASGTLVHTVHAQHHSGSQLHLVLAPAGDRR